MKPSPVSSLQSSSSFCSGSSDSEPPDLSRQLVEQSEVLTVHSYAKEEVNVMEIEQPSRKKTSSTARVDEQELAKVRFHQRVYLQSVLYSMLQTHFNGKAI